MIDLPLRLRLTASFAEAESPQGRGVAEVRASGPTHERARGFALRWLESHGELNESCGDLKNVQQVELDVLESPREHVGLGLGTQLGLAVSYGLTKLFESVDDSLPGCAERVGRGLRSAVGTYGFFYGGLIVDQGKRTGELVSPLHCRVRVPESWRWVLLYGQAPIGLTGSEEQQAFDRLPSMSIDQVERLRQVAFDELVPSVAHSDFDRFATALYSYGRCAGECFASVQGGPYRTSQIEAWVERIRSWGYAGVGQSSWGPTVFVVTRDSAHADALVERVRLTDSTIDVSVCRPRNSGVKIESFEE